MKKLIHWMTVFILGLSMASCELFEEDPDPKFQVEVYNTTNSGIQVLYDNFSSNNQTANRELGVLMPNEVVLFPQNFAYNQSYILEAYVYSFQTGGRAAVPFRSNIFFVDKSVSDDIYKWRVE